MAEPGEGESGAEVLRTRVRGPHPQQEKGSHALKGTWKLLGRITRAGCKTHAHPPLEGEAKNTAVGSTRMSCPRTQPLINIKRPYKLKQSFKAFRSRKHVHGFQCDYMSFVGKKRSLVSRIIIHNTLNM